MEERGREKRGGEGGEGRGRWRVKGWEPALIYIGIFKSRRLWGGALSSTSTPTIVLVAKG